MELGWWVIHMQTGTACAGYWQQEYMCQGCDVEYFLLDREKWLCVLVCYNQHLTVPGEVFFFYLKNKKKPQTQKNNRYMKPMI